MKSSNPAIDQTIGDAQEEIRDLRARLDALLADRVEPALHAAAAQAGDAAEHVRQAISDNADQVAAFVRQRPLTALAVALAAGYVLARVTR